jgi:segregation and condensation protein B
MMRGDMAGDAASEAPAGPGLRACLEAILLVVDEPVAEVVLAQVLERPREEIALEIAGLAASYTAEGRGFELREVAGGWRFYTREECAPVVERFVRDGQEVRLTQAALETLAVVAYRQPVSRARVSAVRGVNCDGVMRTLTLRGLVEEAGTEHETGAILYRTTAYFLERLGLAGLDDLPELAPFLPDQVEDAEGAEDSSLDAVDAQDTESAQRTESAQEAEGLPETEGLPGTDGAPGAERSRNAEACQDAGGWPDAGRAQDAGDADDEPTGP